MVDINTNTLASDEDELSDSTYDEVTSPLESQAFKNSFDAISEGSQSRNGKILVGLPPVNRDSDYGDKGDALEAVCRLLASTSYSSAPASPDLDGIVDYLECLYGGEDRFRHRYSMLCSFMYSELESVSPEDVSRLENIPEPLGMLADNITHVRECAEKRWQCIDSSSDECRTLRWIRRLDDHIELELRRMRYITKQNESLHRSADATKDAFEQKIEDLSSDLGEKFAKQIQGEAEQLEKKFDETIRETEIRSQRNYVSALGIFISLVISFSAGIRLATEVIQAITGMGFYRMSFVLLVVTFALFNLIAILLYFVMGIADFGEREKVEKLVRRVDRAYVACAIAIVAAKIFSPQIAWLP